MPRFFQRHFKDISGVQYDVVIIGGGINGVGIARELALQGLQVALFEKGDFGEGTSSRSSKLIHGGVRYLQYGHFHLVYEAQQERRRLLKNAPHLVKPLPFLIPVYKDSRYGKWMLRFGLFLYDALSLFSNVRPHRWLSAQEVARLEPSVKQEGLKGAVLYYDAQMDDARLCIETALQANRYGADLFNYCEVVHIEADKTKVQSLLVRNLITGEEARVAARFYLNIAGPWVDEVLSRISGHTRSEPLLRPSKGAHVVTRAVTNSHALLITSKQDNRVFFVIPWNGYSLIGTTDTDYSGNLNDVKADGADVAYLISSSNAYLSQSGLSRQDVISSFAGIRPLLHEVGRHVSTVSREHKFIETLSNFCSLVGGKYTTFRSVAEDCAKLVFKKLEIKNRFRSLTRTLPLYGGEITPSVNEFVEKHFEEDYVFYPVVSKDRYATIVSRYGSAYTYVLQILVEEDSYAEPLAFTSYLKGEVIYSIRREMAKTITDFMRRRTRIFFEEGHGLECLESVADLFQRELAWSSERRAEMIAAYKSEVSEMEKDLN